MPFITSFEKIPAFKITKRLGKPNGFGWIIFGWSQFGDNNRFSGVYQGRRRRRWNGVGGFDMISSPKNFFQKPAWPTQPPSVARDAQQAKFKTALEMWQALTNEQKKEYNRLANGAQRRGYDYFMSKTLKSL
jgi:hypothetical protein